MALRGPAANDALWAKLYELEAQLAAYKILHDASLDMNFETGSLRECCRGRQYESYMRRRDARRREGHVLTTSEQTKTAWERSELVRPQSHAGKLSRSGSRRTSLDVQEQQQHQRIEYVQEEQKPPPLSRSSTMKRTSTPPTKGAQSVSTASTLRKENRAPSKEANSTIPRPSTSTLPRSRTVNSGITSAPKEHDSQAKSHHRRNSLAGPVDFSKSTVVSKPFLKRGSGTGAGAGATVAKLRASKVCESPVTDTSIPIQEFTQISHVRSVSDFALASVLDSPKSMELTREASAGARARKKWGSPEKPAMFSGDSQKDFAKGFKKLLNFVRKNKSEHSSGSSDSGKSVKGWSAACSLDGLFDASVAPEQAHSCCYTNSSAANLESHQTDISAKNNWFPVTRAIGISG